MNALMRLLYKRKINIGCEKSIFKFLRCYVLHDIKYVTTEKRGGRNKKLINIKIRRHTLDNL